MPDELSSFVYGIKAREAAWPVLPILESYCDTGEIVYVSQMVANLFGYTVEELLGKEVESLVPEELRDQHRAWRRDVAVPQMRPMGMGRQLHGVKKDGTVFPLHILMTSTQENGRLLGIACIVDLTNILLANKE